MNRSLKGSSGNQDGSSMASLQKSALEPLWLRPYSDGTRFIREICVSQTYLVILIPFESAMSVFFSHNLLIIPEQITCFSPNSVILWEI